MYKQGNVLKSTIRSDKFPIFIMVCGNGRNGQIETDYQFNAVVLYDASIQNDIGTMSNAWNKGRWELSSMKEIKKAEEG